MELCTAQTISNPQSQNSLFASSPALPPKTFLSLRQPQASLAARRLSSRFVLRRAKPEEASKGERSTVGTLEDVSPAEKNGFKQPEIINLGDLPADGDTQSFDFLDNLNVDLGDAYSVILYGSGALAALYLASAVVGAIDSIPLFPQLMEVVGLSYSLWFTYRYLLFKKNRDELAAKIEDLKQRVLGSKD